MWIIFTQHGYVSSSELLVKFSLVLGTLQPVVKNSFADPLQALQLLQLQDPPVKFGKQNSLGSFQSYSKNWA